MNPHHDTICKDIIALVAADQAEAAKEATRRCTEDLPQAEAAAIAAHLFAGVCVGGEGGDAFCVVGRWLIETYGVPVTATNIWYASNRNRNRELTLLACEQYRRTHTDEERDADEWELIDAACEWAYRKDYGVVLGFLRTLGVPFNPKLAHAFLASGSGVTAADIDFVLGNRADVGDFECGFWSPFGGGLLDDEALFKHYVAGAREAGSAYISALVLYLNAQIKSLESRPAWAAHLAKHRGLLAHVRGD